MFIKIGEKIRLRREEKGVTQDELARFLEVNCKDVLKWESGDVYPPIELIPVIANYFGITTDELMCMEQFDNEDKIREYTDGFQEKVSAGDIKGGVEILREGILHFPEEFRLKCLLMYGLYLLCDRPAAVKHYSGELLGLGEEILARCTEDAIRLEAKRLLCLHYYEDLNDPEQARAIALSLPGRKICREDMLPILSVGDAKLTAIQENISAYTTLLTSAISAYVESDATLGKREKIEFCETARQIRRMIYPCGDIFGGAYLHIAPALGAGRAKEALALFGSTSPSYLILQSLDLANVYLASFPPRLRALLEGLEALKERLREAGFVLLGREPMKLTVAAKAFGYLGTELAELLRHGGIECEFADPDVLVLIVTPENTEEDLARLRAALLAIPRKALVSQPAVMPGRGAEAMSVREAMLSPWERIPVAASEGRILASPSVGCPPAVPIAVCGQRIGKEAIECFRYYGIESVAVVK